MGTTNAANAATQQQQNNILLSAIISSLFCFIIFGTLRFYADWFTATQLNTIVGGFVGSWLFVFSLTSISNVEMILFGHDFQAKFIPEIFFSLTLAVIASGVVHRVCATTCILFSIAALYFVNHISTKYHSNKGVIVEPVQYRKASGKKNK